jgi:hypothetical protein
LFVSQKTFLIARLFVTICSIDAVRISTVQLLKVATISTVWLAKRPDAAALCKLVYPY